MPPAKDNKNLTHIFPRKLLTGRGTDRKTTTLFYRTFMLCTFLISENIFFAKVTYWGTSKERFRSLNLFQLTSQNFAFCGIFKFKMISAEIYIKNWCQKIFEIEKVLTVPLTKFQAYATLSWQLLKLFFINQIVSLWRWGLHFDKRNPISIVQCFYEVTPLPSFIIESCKKDF